MMPVRAQDARTTRAGLTPVYVERFTTQPSSAPDDIARFSSTYIQLELSKLPQLRVRSVITAPACRAPNGNTAYQREAPPKADESFVIKGGVDGSEDSTYVVDIEVTRCSKGVPYLALHQSRVFRTRNATSELLAFSSLVSDRIRTVGLPTVSVLVTPSSVQSAAMPLNAFRDRIISSIRDMGAAEPVDTGSSQYAISISLQGSASVPTALRLQFTAEGRAAGFVDVPRGQLGLTPFVAKVAEQSARKLDELIHTPELAFGTQRAVPLRDSVIARARQALCLGQPTGCRTAPDVATAALGAIAASPTDVDVLTLRGIADLSLGKLASALSELTRADSLRALAPMVKRIPEASEWNLQMAIAAVYKTAGNYTFAARRYRLLANEAPQDATVQLLLAQSLRLAGRRIEAFDVASRAMLRLGEHALRDEANAGVEDITFNIVVDSLSSLVPLCERDAQLRLVCAATFAEKAGEATARGLPLLKSKGALEAALRLAATDQLTVRRVAVAFATAYIGRPFAFFEGDLLKYSSSGFQADSVRRYVAIAEAQAIGELPDSARARLHRARANYAALGGDFTLGFTEAREAYQSLPNAEDAVLATMLAMVVSSHARAPQADSLALAYGKQWDALRTDARAFIDDAWQRFPEDEAVIETRSHWCADYAFDSRCLYESDSVRFTRGLLRSPGSVLDAVEAAVLSDHASTALEWLKRVKLESLDGCLRSVAGLYEFWATSELKGSGTALSFDGWQRGIKQYRRDGGGTCWLFRGALDRLARPPQPRQRNLFEAMIRAFEDAASPIPSFPGRAAS